MTPGEKVIEALASIDDQNMSPEIKAFGVAKALLVQYGAILAEMQMIGKMLESPSDEAMRKKLLKRGNISSKKLLEIIGAMDELLYGDGADTLGIKFDDEFAADMKNSLKIFIQVRDAFVRDVLST